MNQVALRRCHAPRGGLIFIQSATAVQNVAPALLLPIRFGRVKSNARDSKPERRPNPELLFVNRYLPLADERLVRMTRPGSCKGAREDSEERRGTKGSLRSYRNLT